MISNCICIQIFCASSYYWNDFKKQNKKISKLTPKLPTFSQRHAVKRWRNMCVMFALPFSQKCIHAYWYPRPLYACIEYPGKICVWPGEELPVYFWMKINWVAVGPPTSCLISDLKSLWVGRPQKLIPSFTLLNSFSMSAQAPSVSFMIRRWHLKEIWQYLILTHKGMFRVFIIWRGCTMPYWYIGTSASAIRNFHCIYYEDRDKAECICWLKLRVFFLPVPFILIRRQVLTASIFSGYIKSKHEISGNSTSAVKLLEPNELD